MVSKKHRDWKKCKYVLAVKIESPKLKNCGGVTMELVQKVLDDNFINSSDLTLPRLLKL